MSSSDYLLDNISVIDAQELKEYFKAHKEDEYELIDVRQPEEYEESHIPGAKLIPLGTLEPNLEQINPQKELILYCRSGKRSMVAAMFVFESDLKPKKTISLINGILGWDGQVLIDYPNISSIPPGLSFQEYLKIAIEMEKGAMNFYSKLGNELKLPFAANFKKLSGLEEAHAKRIFEFLRSSDQEFQSASFEQYFDNLAGDILEGGEPLDTLIKQASQLRNCIDLADLAIEIEFKAYDIYKIMAGMEKDPEAEKVFHFLADQEKVHARTIANSIGDCL